MKSYLFTIIISLQIANLFSQSPTWITIVDKTPIYKLSGYSWIKDTAQIGFSLPNYPLIIDTLSVKLYSTNSDSAIFFQVFNLKETQLDSSNLSFTEALQLSPSDTLSAIVNSFIGSTNSSQTSMNPLAITNGFKGVEMNLTYNDLYEGRVLLSYTRIYYKPKLLLTFMIAGFQDDLTNLTANKNTFFNSITLGSSNY